MHYCLKTHSVFFKNVINRGKFSWDNGGNIKLASEQMLPSKPQKQVLYLPFSATRTPQIMRDSHPIQLHLHLCLDAEKEEGERKRKIREGWKEQRKTVAK